VIDLNRALQDASTMSTTKSKKEARALGAMERLFWLMDHKGVVIPVITIGSTNLIEMVGLRSCGVKMASGLDQ